ncbi:MAG: Ig-like domain-containing protein, partial [Nitrosomonas sp.]
MAVNPVIQKADSFAQNSKAQNDNFSNLSSGRDSFVLDVLENDQGDLLKVLWSLDEGSGAWNEPGDLLTRDNYDAINYSELGAQISITKYGTVSYVITPELQSKLKDLSTGESLTDTFIYAMKVGQGNSPLSWAKATVTLNGLNHAPELTGTTAILPNGTENTGYEILASDLLKGFTDADKDEIAIKNLSVTHGTLAETANGWIFTPENDFSGDVELSYDIVDGHGGSLGATLKFTLDPAFVDADPPALLFVEPADDATAVSVTNNIVLHFDEGVVPVSGNIVVTNGTDTRLIAVDDSSQVTFSGSKVIINPSTNLVPNTTYHVEIAKGVIADYSGNPYDGITDPTTLNFTTIADTTPPALSWSWPFDGQSFKIDDNITLGFTEEIKVGTGNIIISNGTDTRVIAINDASQVTINNSTGFGTVNFGTITINPTEDLILDSTYSIQIAAGVVTDTSGNAWAGINDALSFSTIGPGPLLSWSNPGDDATDFQMDSTIGLSFDEAVKPGSTGNIIISNGSDTRIISINDSSQVTFDGYNGVTINPTEDLVPNTHYSIRIDNGAITDWDGNPYAGISDDTTLDFSTVTSEPLLYNSYPGDDSTDFQVDQNIGLFFNEPVKPGDSGNIIISNGADTRIISINDSSQVTFDGYSGVLINPATDLIPNTHYSIKIDSGAITDLNGNPFAGISDDTTLDFSTVSSEPQLFWSNPSDNATDFQVDSNIQLFFNEMVQAGSNGNIVISNGSDTRTIAINDASQVTFDGYNSVTINPAADLVPNTHYSIRIDNGAITDLNGHAYTGINDDTALDFSTITSEPRFTGGTPSDDSTGFQTDQDLVLYFNEPIQSGGSGNIVLSNGTDTRTIAITDASQVTFNGSKITINPTDDLVPNTNYSVKIDNGAITDLNGHAYAGISDDTTLNFSTISSEPQLIVSNPWDDSIGFQVDQNIKLYFNEQVKPGDSGNIVISNGSDTRTIAIDDASQVTFSGGKVTINPIDDLVPNTNYSIKIDSTAITDLDGNPYTGINDDTTLNFSTITGEPLLSSSTPWNGFTDFPADNNITLAFNEEVQAGSSGNIVISNGSDTRTIAISDASQVTFNGSKITVNPTADLVPNTNYSILIDNGAILDLSGNAYAGISDDTTLNFSTVTTEPRLSWSNPWDGSTDFQVDQDFVLTFNQLVKQGANGNIIISNGSDTRTIAINDSSQVTFDGYTSVIINPTDDLIANSHYNIKIDSGAITDSEGNSFAGISDDTTLDFSTISSDPQLYISYPWDDFIGFQMDRDIELYFTEQVKPGGSGNIIISNGSDTRTIPINDASQVSFDNSSRVIINPLADLIPDSHYNIRIDSGAITDLTGHAYAGISDDTALDFTTITGEPRLDGSIPGDDSIDFQVDRNITLYFNEPVKPGGSGNIIISNGSDTRTISINDSNQVTFDGYTGVFINPTSDLVPNTDYSIRIDSGAITDLTGNPYAGIHDDTTLNFTTVPSNPLLIDSSPLDNASNVAVGDNIVLYFNEEIKPASGNIVISNGTDIRTISINDSSQVTFSDSKFGGNQILINPIADLVPNTDYSIRIDNGAIIDLTGNSYAGINDDTTLNFTTLSSNPLLFGSSPMDDAADVAVGNNIVLYFNEEIKPASGNIVISNGTDIRTISINDSSQVTFSDSKFGSNQ